jgi:hypothetical protein
MRIDWTALPQAVRTEITDRVGGSHTVPAVSGDHAEIASTVISAKGMVFVKAAHSDLGVRSLRYELLASKAVTQLYSPAVEWDFEAAGWLVVGFEHCAGPHADLSPGTSDLDLLAATLTELAETPAPDHVPWFSSTGRLGFAHPAMDGDTLVHTDLNPANLIVTPNGLRIVDWAFAAKAAAWVELALLAQWLIGSGHTPEQAESWLAQSPAWSATNPEIIDHFAMKNATKWATKAQQNTAPWVQDLAAWNGQWSAHRREDALKPRT